MKINSIKNVHYAYFLFFMRLRRNSSRMASERSENFLRNMIFQGIPDLVEVVCPILCS